MWRISIAIRRVVRTTLLRLAARLEEPDAAPPRPPDEEGIPADWLARVRRGAPQLLRKDAPSHAAVRRPIARSGVGEDARTEVAQPPRVVEDATAAARSRDARSHTPPDETAPPPHAPRVDDATPIRPRAPRLEERALTTPRLVPRIVDDAPPGPSPNTTGTHSDASPDEPRARSRQSTTGSPPGPPDPAAARPSTHSFDSPAESQVVSRLASERFGSPSAHRHALTRASRFPPPQAGERQPFDSREVAPARLPAPHDARDNAPAALAEPRQEAVVAPYHSEYQEQWQTVNHEQWHNSYHSQSHERYHNLYHQFSHVAVRDGESSTLEPRPSWPELPDAPLFGIPLTPIGSFDDAEHLARLSDEQRGSAWSE